MRAVTAAAVTAGITMAVPPVQASFDLEVADPAALYLEADGQDRWVLIGEPVRRGRIRCSTRRADRADRHHWVISLKNSAAASGNDVAVKPMLSCACRSAAVQPCGPVPSTGLGTTPGQSLATVGPPQAVAVGPPSDADVGVGVMQVEDTVGRVKIWMGAQALRRVAAGRDRWCGSWLLSRVVDNGDADCAVAIGRAGVGRAGFLRFLLAALGEGEGRGEVGGGCEAAQFFQQAVLVDTEGGCVDDWPPAIWWATSDASEA